MDRPDPAIRLQDLDEISLSGLGALGLALFLLSPRRRKPQATCWEKSSRRSMQLPWGTLHVLSEGTATAEFRSSAPLRWSPSGPMIPTPVTPPAEFSRWTSPDRPRCLDFRDGSHSLVARGDEKALLPQRDSGTNSDRVERLLTRAFQLLAPFRPFSAARTVSSPRPTTVIA